LIIMKFGGTSVGGATAIAQVVEIVRRFRAGELPHLLAQENRRLVLVTSAMSGVTDRLLTAARQAAHRDGATFRRVAGELRAAHHQAAEALVANPSRRASLLWELDALLNDFESLCQAIYVLGEVTNRGMDAVASTGERLSVRLLAAALVESGLPAQVVESTHLVVTDDNFGNASPLMEETRLASQSMLAPILALGEIPVVTGFIGATREGTTTTLGRGGSDYLAAILGAALDTAEIWIWTDVDGVLTADPRVVAEACTLPRISYGEAAELSYFGAKVLHPKTILPAVQRGIPLRILNTFHPDHPGTRVEKEEAGEIPVKGITSIQGLCQVTVEGKGMIGVPGIAAKLFACVASQEISVLMISQSSSEQNICIVIPQEASERALRALEAGFASERARQNVERIWSQDAVAILAVVGAGMKDTPGIGAKVFGALGNRGINIISVAQGSSKYNLSLVVSEEETDRAVRAIHQDLGLAGLSGEANR